MTGPRTSLALDKWWLAVPLCIILGTAAALVAVYVVTPTDVTKTGKLIGFAVLCGFLWKPVLDAGRVTLNRSLKTKSAPAQIKTKVDQLRTTKAAPAAIGVDAHEAGSQVADFLSTSNRLDSSGLDVQAKDAVKVIAETSKENPVAAALALVDIKNAAEGSSNNGVAKLAAEKIESIRQAAPPDVAKMIPPPNQE